MKNIGISIYKYRWIIAAAIFIICVILGINGSSIGEWSSFLGGEDTGLLLGVSRAIRGDEWATSTPMALSQYFDASGAFSYFSDVVIGMPTDVFLEYGQPVRDIAVLFRPFHWGYLFLSPDSIQNTACRTDAVPSLACAAYTVCHSVSSGSPF